MHGMLTHDAVRMLISRPDEVSQFFLPVLLQGLACRDFPPLREGLIVHLHLNLY